MIKKQCMNILGSSAKRLWCVKHLSKTCMCCNQTLCFARWF